MTDRPIIFSAPMVRALLAGHKTQTRRIQKKDFGLAGTILNQTGRNPVAIDELAWDRRWPVRTTYQVRDRLWVREAHALVPASAYRMSEGVAQTVNTNDKDGACIYREGWERSTGGLRWRPSIHMPRWASRLTLTVTDVRVQRLQEISEADALAEGVSADRSIQNAHNHWVDIGGGELITGWDAREVYAVLWDHLYGYGAWAQNPWVAATTFSVKLGNIDQIGGA